MREVLFYKGRRLVAYTLPPRSNCNNTDTLLNSEYKSVRDATLLEVAAEKGIEHRAISRRFQKHRWVR